MEKICKHCGKLLDISCFMRNKGLIDGYENMCKSCRLEQRKKYINKCVICGTEFKTATKSSKYCSQECIGELRKNRVTTKCSYCSKEIEFIKYKSTCEYHYCNQTCRTKHLKVLLLKENNPNYNHVEHKCDGCGKTMLTIPSKIKDQKYIFCSNECYKINIGKYFSTENNSNYNSELTVEERIIGRNYEDYHNWRKNVFIRDDYTCKCCGDSKGHNLAAHHILNYTEYKDTRTDLNNGITLCNNCHKLFHNTYGYTKNNENQLNIFIRENA